MSGDKISAVMYRSLSDNLITSAMHGDEVINRGETLTAELMLP